MHCVPSRAENWRGLAGALRGFLFLWNAMVGGMEFKLLMAMRLAGEMVLASEVVLDVMVLRVLRDGGDGP
jgi:hypothetical protein